MKTDKLMYVVKKAAVTGGEVAVVGASMIATKHLLDFNKIFKKKIENDPAFADKWFMKHQGLIRFGVGCTAAYFIKNPWLKLVAMGVAIEGAITEGRYLSNNTIEAIGQNNAPDDAEMMRVAAEYDNNMSGPNDDGRITVIAGPNDDGRIQVIGAIDLSDSIQYSMGASETTIWAP